MIVYMCGCTHNCKGCHNPDLQNPKHGFDISILELLDSYLKMELCNCIVFSGGDPLYQYNELLLFCKELSKSIDICIYTGETFENVPVELFKYIKLLKTEPYIESLGPVTANTTNQQFYDIIDEKPIQNNQYFKVKENNKC